MLGEKSARATRLSILVSHFRQEHETKIINAMVSAMEAKCSVEMDTM